MLSPYKFPSKNNKGRQKASSDLKRRQMTAPKPNPSADSVIETVKYVKNKNKWNRIGIEEVDED